MNKRNQILTILALSLLIALAGHIASALACLFVAQFIIAKPHGRLCAVTLSAPEILKDILDAFKIETPEVLGQTASARTLAQTRRYWGIR